MIYIAISITAVSVVSYEALGKSGQPLVDVVTTAAPSFPREIFSFISLFAITNTALLNYIMVRAHRWQARQAWCAHLAQCILATHPHIAICVLKLLVMCWHVSRWAGGRCDQCALVMPVLHHYQCSLCVEAPSTSQRRV
jgi:hypothetical protein